MQVLRATASLREQAADAVREAIVRGELPPGQRLVERQLCEQLGISRATLREAYRQLEVEGFITLTPYRGPVVTTLDPVEAQAVYDVRAALECQAMHLFATRATDAMAEVLAGAVKALRQAHERGDATAMLESKRALYAALYDGAQSPMLAQQATLVQDRLWHLRAQSLSQPGRPMASMSEIEEAMDALVSRDAAAATERWRLHLGNAAAAALAAWGTGGAPATQAPGHRT